MVSRNVNRLTGCIIGISAVAFSYYRVSTSPDNFTPFLDDQIATVTSNIELKSMAKQRLIEAFGPLSGDSRQWRQKKIKVDCPNVTEEEIRQAKQQQGQLSRTLYKERRKFLTLNQVAWNNQ